MKKYQDVAILLLRIALAANFLSAVASRLSLWGNPSDGWEKFLAYAGQVNSFAPKSIIPILAITSTVLETTLAILLLIGFKTRWAAIGTAILTLLFALAMAYSFGIESPLDYSVPADFTGAFLLATMPHYRWSIIIGFIAGHLTERFNCNGELEWINVIPAYRRSGIAFELLCLLASWFIEQKALKICVDVGSDAARQFYTKHGAENLNEHWLVWKDISVVLQDS